MTVGLTNLMHSIQTLESDISKLVNTLEQDFSSLLSGLGGLGQTNNTTGGNTYNIYIDDNNNNNNNDTSVKGNHDNNDGGASRYERVGPPISLPIMPQPIAHPELV